MWTVIFVTLIVLMCYLLKKLSEEIQKRKQVEAFLTQERIHAKHRDDEINNLGDDYIASLDMNDRLRRNMQAARRAERKARRSQQDLQHRFNYVEWSLEQMTAERDQHSEASQTLSSELFRADSDVNFWRERAHTGCNLLEKNFNFLSYCALLLGDSSDTARNAALPNSPDLGKIEFVPVPFDDFEKFVNFVNTEGKETGAFTASLA